MEQMLSLDPPQPQNWNWKTSRCNQYISGVLKKKKATEETNKLFSTNKDFLGRNNFVALGFLIPLLSSDDIIHQAKLG